MKLTSSGIVRFRSPQLKWAPKYGLFTFHLTHPHKLDAANRRFEEVIHEDLVALQQAISREALVAHINDLPALLVDLWTLGIPLDGGEPLVTPEQRRRAMLGYWATRLDTDEGRRIQREVESWLRDHVQTSPTPITEEELAWAASLRDDERRPDVGVPLGGGLSPGLP